MSKTLAALALVVSGLLGASNAPAQTWPDRPIRLISSSGSGGSGDFVARYLADKLSQSLGQSVVVDNRPGASGIIAAKALIGARPDGYTLLLFFGDNLAIAPQLVEKSPFDSIKDFTYIGAVARSRSFFLAVHPSVPAQTFEDYIKLAKSSPGKLTYSTYGQGSFPHLSFEMMSAKAAIEMLHVPYKGGLESQRAAVAGAVDAVSAINIVELIKGGKLRALAVGGAQRSEQLPSVRTFAELGHGDEIFGPVIYALAAPAGLPAQILGRLATEVRKAAEAPDAVQKMAGIASEPFWASGEQIQRTIGRAITTYAPLIEKLGLPKQ